MHNNTPTVVGTSIYLVCIVYSIKNCKNTTHVAIFMVYVMGDNAVDIIRQEIENYPGSKKWQGKSVYVPCPFHDETEPSCGLVISEDHELPIGTFNCFGCGEHGSWNKFAKRANLSEVKGWKFFQGTTNSVLSREDETKMLGTDYSIASKLKSKAFITWPEHLNWRGYSGRLLNRLQAESFNDPVTDEPMIVFPVVMNRKVRGAVRAFMHKKEGRSSYLTTEGKWIKTYGLFPFDDAKAKIKRYKHDFVILVEGPRDVLRLIKLGLPAIAILGANSLTDKKLLMVRALLPDRCTIYVMSDNDRAGRQMFESIKNITWKMEAHTERILMPNETDDSGEKIKYDPDNCPVWYMKRVLKYLEDKHDSFKKQRRRK